ncbi:MAG: type II toxin-antitoxin system HicB family antitoxin [Candidatus Micrarchaeota archaeon]
MIANMKKEFVVVIEKGLDGYWIADVPELPGCHTQAKTKPELRLLVKEAIELYLDVQRERGPVRISAIQVEKVVVNA